VAEAGGQRVHCEGSDYAIGEEGSKVEERVWVRLLVLRIFTWRADVFGFLSFL